MFVMMRSITADSGSSHRPKSILKLPTWIQGNTVWCSARLGEPLELEAALERAEVLHRRTGARSTDMPDWLETAAALSTGAVAERCTALASVLRSDLAVAST